MKKLFKIIAVVNIVLSSSISSAQHLGIEAGLNYDQQIGHFQAPCGCTFAGGTGISFFGSLSYELFSFSDFVTGITTGIRNNHVTDYEVEPASLQRILNGDRQQTNLLYITIGPYLQYTIPSTSIFLAFSPQVGYLLSKNFHHIGGSSSDEPEIGNSDTTIDIRSVRLATKLSAGYNIIIGNFTVSPILSFDFPLNTLRSNSTDGGWRITSLSGSIMVRFNL